MTAALVSLPEIPSSDALQTKSSLLEMRSAELEVTDQASMDEAGSFLRDVKALIVEIKAACDPVCEKAHAAHKAATNLRSAFLAAPLAAEAAVKAKISAYVTEQQRIQREAEARAALEYRRAQEEARKQAEELRKAAEPELAEIVEVQAELAVPAPPPPPPRTAGIVTPETWHFEVTDFRALVEAVAKGEVPIEALIPNEKLLRQQAVSLKQSLRWPGVRVFSKAGVSVR